ncbi:MAG: hypothetical protein C4318_06415 [Acidimicrobiia bacterium]
MSGESSVLVNKSDPSVSRVSSSHFYLRTNASKVTVIFFALTLVTSSCSGLKKSAPPSLFEEVASGVGIDYTQFRPYECFDPPPCGPLYMSGGAASGDYDNDGYVDLVVTRVNEFPILYRNDGNGHFTDVTAGSGLNIPEARRTNGAAFVDVDSDGCLDLAMTVLYSHRNLLFMGDCRGHFREEGLQRGFAEERAEPSVYGYGIAAGDYDKDGYVDLYVGEWRFDLTFPGAPSDSKLLHNLGAAAPGHFEDASSKAGVTPQKIGGLLTGRFWWTPAFVDLDNDGFQDLLLVGDFASTKLYWNNGDGTFTESTMKAGVGTEENGMGLALGDFNNDGFIDIFVSSIFQTHQCEVAKNEEEICAHWGTSGNRLFKNNGNRTFEDVTDKAGVRNGRWGWGASFLDYDDDGFLDIVQTAGQFYPYPDFRADNFYDDPSFLWKNLNGNTFADVSRDAGLDKVRRGKGLLVMDFDHDGLQDVFVVQNSDKPKLYRNLGAQPRGNWIEVELKGAGPSEKGSNLQGIGAVVKVAPSGGPHVLTAQSVGGSSFLGQNSPALHFGIGTSTEARKVEVYWPVSGCHQESQNVPARSRILFSEQECLRARPRQAG